MKILTLSLTVAAALFPMAAMCEEPSAVIQIGREVVKEGRTSAHRKVEADWTRSLRNAKFPYHYLALEGMTGAGEAWFVSGFPSFAAIEDNEALLFKEPLQTTVAILDARDGEVRASSRSMLAVYRKDMSYHPERANTGKTRYMGVSTFRVKLGHMPDFMAGSKIFLAAYEKMNYPHPSIVYQVVAGAPEGMFLFFMPMESLKAMDSMAEVERDLPKAMGVEEFGKMMKGAGDVFTSIEASFFRVSPQMSYVSKETEDVDPAYWRPKVPAKPVADAKPKA